jgi:hypothetical protein
MTRPCPRLGLSAALITLALLVSAPCSASAQDLAKQPGKKPATPTKPAALLTELLDTADLQQPLTLKEALIHLYEQLNARGLELPLLVDSDAFKEENPDAPDVYETQIRFPPVPKRITVAQFLRHVLSRIPTGNGTFLLFGDHIEVTTFQRASAEVRLQQPVLASFDNRKLSDVLRELSEMTATSIIIDKRAGDKEDRIVSATFRNEVSLAGALRVLTEMADLKAVVLEGTIFVTTPQHAKALREEKLQMDEQLSPLWPVLPPFPGRSKMDAAR